MASRRVAKSTVDWARLQKLLPADQQQIYTNLLSKSYQQTLKVASLPENLPKIDFEAYKKQLANPAAIEKLEKGYLAFQTPAPRDSENLLSKVDQQEKEENARLVEYLKGVAKLIEGLKAEKFKLTNIPPLEEMTKELEVYYFPEKYPDYKEVLQEPDLYMKKLEDRKKGGHHH